MNRQQFISQVEHTSEAFRRFLVALCCGDRELADDIAQESYMKAYVASDSLTDIAKFKAWIFRIGYTTFINYRRKNQAYADYDEAARMPSAERADDGLRYQDLYAALNLLPGKERSSVLLYYMEGYSVKEIAEIEGTSQDAVRQHLSRGRTHLRGLLK